MSAYAAGGLDSGRRRSCSIFPTTSPTHASPPTRTGSSVPAPSSTRIVRDAYRSLAAERGWVVVDGTGSREEVADRVWAAVEPRALTSRSVRWCQKSTSSVRSARSRRCETRGGAPVACVPARRRRGVRVSKMRARDFAARLVGAGRRPGPATRRARPAPRRRRVRARRRRRTRSRMSASGCCPKRTAARSKASARSCCCSRRRSSRVPPERRRERDAEDARGAAARRRSSCSSRRAPTTCRRRSGHAVSASTSTRSPDDARRRARTRRRPGRACCARRCRSPAASSRVRARSRVRWPTCVRCSPAAPGRLDGTGATALAVAEQLDAAVVRRGGRSRPPARRGAARVRRGDGTARLLGPRRAAHAPAPRRAAQARSAPHAHRSPARRCHRDRVGVPRCDRRSRTAPERRSEPLTLAPREAAAAFDACRDAREAFPINEKGMVRLTRAPDHAAPATDEPLTGGSASVHCPPPRRSSSDGRAAHS